MKIVELLAQLLDEREITYKLDLGYTSTDYIDVEPGVEILITKSGKNDLVILKTEIKVSDPKSLDKIMSIIDMASEKS